MKPTPERPPAVRDPYDRRDDPKTRLNLIRLRSHRLIAEKIDADPSLLEIPPQNLDRWRELGGGEDCPASAEWRDLLKQPWEKTRALIVADTEESTRLRLSTPFVGILTPEEREHFHGPVDTVYKRRAERVIREGCNGRHPTRSPGRVAGEAHGRRAPRSGKIRPWWKRAILFFRTNPDAYSKAWRDGCCGTFPSGRW